MAPVDNRHTEEAKKEKEYPPQHDDDAFICSFRNKK
jgi:hypothetical protein